MSPQEQYNPGERLAFKCQHCAELTLNATVQQMRVAGWRIWTGTTASGEERSVVACPTCAVGANLNADGEKEGYDAHCVTCDASMSEEEGWDDDEEPFTEADAKRWCRDHDCEPDTHVIPPKAVDRRGLDESAPMSPTDVQASAAFV